MLHVQNPGVETPYFGSSQAWKADHCIWANRRDLTQKADSSGCYLLTLHTNTSWIPVPQCVFTYGCNFHDDFENTSALRLRFLQIFGLHPLTGKHGDISSVCQAVCPLRQQGTYCLGHGSSGCSVVVEEPVGCSRLPTPFLHLYSSQAGALLVLTAAENFLMSTSIPFFPS